MGQVTINELIDLETLERVAPIIRNAAHPLRLRILDYLARAEPKTVSEIVDVCGGASQSVVSQQLRILRDQGVVSAKRDGHNMYYMIDDRSLLFLLECIRVHSGLRTNTRPMATASHLSTP